MQGVDADRGKSSTRTPPVTQPRPHFEPGPDDPPWLIDAVRLHGHLGPWLAVGLRVGQEALAALGCEGFFDIRVRVCGPIAKPPSRCIVDGIQFATGATLGKDNIEVVPAHDFEIVATNTKTGQEVRYGLREQLLADIDRVTHETAEQVARTIATRQFDTIARTVKPPS